VETTETKNMKNRLFIGILFLVFISATNADDLANLLQDLAVQTACLGMYSTAQTGVYVTSRYDDPPDWYDPPMMANRFAATSGNMTRTITFYGVCFDYAQFAWDDIKKNQKLYNDAGMKGQQWYIATSNQNDPNTIILYDPVSKEKATIFNNGVYLKENSRHKIYAHDGATGHAWLWVQHNNGTWYWIDPTWTDNTGYPWWGIVKDGKEVQYYPDPSYCVASNYPRPGRTNTETRSQNSTYTNNTSANNASSANYNYSNSYFLIGYNYINNLPLGFTIGGDLSYLSVNFGGEGQYEVTEWVIGLAFPLGDFFLLPIGIGGNHSDPGDPGEEWVHKFVMEIGIQPTIGFLYLSATYRLTGFKESSFVLGAGFIFR
jgi:hypothetical protein